MANDKTDDELKPIFLYLVKGGAAEYQNLYQFTIQTDENVPKYAVEKHKFDNGSEQGVN